MKTPESEWAGSYKQTVPQGRESREPETWEAAWVPAPVTKDLNKRTKPCLWCSWKGMSPKNLSSYPSLTTPCGPELLAQCPSAWHRKRRNKSPWNPISQVQNRDFTCLTGLLSGKKKKKECGKGIRKYLTCLEQVLHKYRFLFLLVSDDLPHLPSVEAGDKEW